MTYCEDYPCCGHTNDDPCARQPYDEPGYYDTTIRGNEHALCDHEFGECNVEDWDDEPECDENHDCLDCDGPDMAEPWWKCSYCERKCPDDAHDPTPVERWEVTEGAGYSPDTRDEHDPSL